MNKNCGMQELGGIFERSLAIATGLIVVLNHAGIFWRLLGQCMTGNGLFSVPGPSYVLGF